MTSVTIRFPEKLSRELKKTAREQGVPVSDVVRDAVRRQLAIQRFKSLRAMTVPFAEKAGFLTDEDVFKAGS